MSRQTYAVRHDGLFSYGITISKQISQLIKYHIKWGLIIVAQIVLIVFSF
jgi:hypothetical protein